MVKKIKPKPKRKPKQKPKNGNTVKGKGRRLTSGARKRKVNTGRA